ncbi:hypothetical protein [Chryseobacterium sp.]|uniref:hypothetical protein n=1 Tax=Chryseobacterium sp. TaxID=1871047 RepID=UPI0025BCBCDF|nr:hypothetical protein [Chryseobacterium sp.]MBV8325740.1 hypothetical protein [Chryseobacterium sp.]
MFHKALIFSLGILALTGCDAQKKIKTETKTSEMSTSTASTKASDQKGDIIYFTQGQNKFLKEAEVNITFKGISEDSRCPEGTNCIWAGVAVAKIEVMGITTRPETISLASMDHPARNYHQSADFNGYTITLQEVTPYPKSSDGLRIPAEKYKIGITVKKTENTSGATTK